MGKPSELIRVNKAFKQTLAQEFGQITLKENGRFSYPMAADMMLQKIKELERKIKELER